MSDEKRHRRGCVPMLSVYGNMFGRRRRAASMGSFNQYQPASSGELQPETKPAPPKRTVSVNSLAHHQVGRTSATAGGSKAIVQIHGPVALVQVQQPPVVIHNSVVASAQSAGEGSMVVVENSLVPATQVADDGSMVAVQPMVNVKPKKQPAPQKPPAVPASGTYTGIAAEIDELIRATHKNTVASAAGGLMRATTSGNVLMNRNLGNLGGKAKATASAATKTAIDAAPLALPSSESPAATKTPGEVRIPPTGKKPYAASFGNIVRAPGNALPAAAAASPAREKAAAEASSAAEAELLKEKGNKEYRQGQFAEAVALYEKAIAANPGKPSYWSNKAAAQTAQGRLLDAVQSCKEAIVVDPGYHKAHRRLATLYLRLGEADKAIHHFKQSAPARDSAGPDVPHAQAVKMHLAQCNDARKLKDWTTVLDATQSAVCSGADFSPHVRALQAEALLKLRRHDEADAALSALPKFGADESARFFGTASHAYVLMIQAQVDMAAGRFEEAVAAAEAAAQLDPTSREVGNVVRRSRVVAAARRRGNELFNAGKFAEASVAYGEGLDKEAYNAVLLCNRAACHARLGSFEKAVDDCEAALAVRPGYRKARIRRADCYAKLGKWEAATREYQQLIQELPDSEEVKKALQESQAQLRSEADTKVTPGRSSVQ